MPFVNQQGLTRHYLDRYIMGRRDYIASARGISRNSVDEGPDAGFVVDADDADVSAVVGGEGYSDYFHIPSYAVYELSASFSIFAVMKAMNNTAASGSRYPYCPIPYGPTGCCEDNTK